MPWGKPKAEQQKSPPSSIEAAGKEDVLKAVCGSDEELYSSLRTLGLFLNRQEQREVDRYLEEVRRLEAEKGPAQEARYAYRILIRLGLQLNRPDLVKEHAQRETAFASDKSYLKPFIERTEDTIAAAKKYYDKIFAEKIEPKAI